MSTILACTDGSPYANSIYQYAAWAALKVDAGVLVLHVIEREEAGKPSDLTGKLGFDASAELMEELVSLDEAHARVARLRGKAILDDAIGQLKAAGVSNISATQRHGSLVETLDEFEEHAGLLVIGKRGENSGLATGHLGSNLERVVRTSRVPLLVASREFRPVNRVLIAFDGGSSALKAVHYIASRPLLEGADLHLVAVGKPGGTLARDLEHAATGLRGAGFGVKADLLPGDADEVIAETVENRQIDLLVMGAYGHSAIRRLIIGSTTTSLIRTCRIPILLFR